MTFSSNDWLSHTLPRVQIKERREILLGSANAIGQVSLEDSIAGQSIAGLITPDSRRLENILETMDPFLVGEERYTQDACRGYILQKLEPVIGR